MTNLVLENEMTLINRHLGYYRVQLSHLDNTTHNNWRTCYAHTVTSLTLDPTLQAENMLGEHSFGRLILFITSTPLHQMGILECQLETLGKKHSSLE